MRSPIPHNQASTLLAALLVLSTGMRVGATSLHAMRSGDPIPNSFVVVLHEAANFSAHREWLANHVSQNYNSHPVATAYSSPIIQDLGHIASSGSISAASVMPATMPAYHIAGISPGFAASISGREDVKVVAPNRVVKAHGVQGAAPNWGLVAIGSDGIAGHYSYNDNAGDGVDVYVLDTGVNTAHPDLGGRALQVVSFVENGTHTDVDGHGTHVAGIIASNSYGVAKKAFILAVRVLDDTGSGTTASVVSGLNYVLADSTRGPDRQKIINLSLGGCKDDVLNMAATHVVHSGKIPVVASAGNGNGDDACTNSPAGANAVYAVAASNRDGSFAQYSSVGVCVSVVAPGTDIVSLSNDGKGVVTMSGTSMAAPHVTGTMAILMSQRSFASVGDLYDAINQLALNHGVTIASAPPSTFKFQLFNGGIDGANLKDQTGQPVVTAPKAGNDTAALGAAASAAQKHLAVFQPYSLKAESVSPASSSVTVSSCALNDCVSNASCSYCIVPIKMVHMARKAGHIDAIIPSSSTTDDSCMFPSCLDSDSPCESCIVSRSDVISVQTKEADAGNLIMDTPSSNTSAPTTTRSTLPSGRVAAVPFHPKKTPIADPTTSTGSSNIATAPAKLPAPPSLATPLHSCDIRTCITESACTSCAVPMNLILLAREAGQLMPLNTPAVAPAGGRCIFPACMDIGCETCALPRSTVLSIHDKGFYSDVTSTSIANSY